MAGTLPLGWAVWLSARSLCGPPGLCGGGGAGQEARQEGALQSDSVSSCHRSWPGASGLSCLGAVGAGVLPHREEAAGAPGASSRCPTETSAGSEVWRVARNQERSSVSAALNLCPKWGPDPLADRLRVTGRQMQAVDPPERRAHGGLGLLGVFCGLGHHGCLGWPRHQSWCRGVSTRRGHAVGLPRKTCVNDCPPGGDGPGLPRGSEEGLGASFGVVFWGHLLKRGLSAASILPPLESSRSAPYEPALRPAPGSRQSMGVCGPSGHV